MIDIEDLVEYLYKEGKIRRHRGVRNGNTSNHSVLSLTFKLNNIQGN